MEDGRGTYLRAGLRLLPLVFTALVLGAVALSLLRLLGTDHPDVGFFRSNSHDGLALKAGQGIFNDPDEGYTGLLYTPGLPALLALLYEVRLWAGWAPLVTMLSVFALAGMAGGLALGRGPRTVGAVLGALGVAGLSTWLVTPLVGDYFTGAGPDHLCWALAFGGLLLVPRAALGSTRAAVAAVALLTAAFWVKQPGALAGVVAAGWLGWQAVRGRIAWGPVVQVVGGLAAVNLVLLVAINVATDGQQWALNVELGREHVRLYGARRIVEDAFRGLAVAALVAGLLGLIARGRGWREPSVPSLLAAFAIFALPALMVFRAKQGGEDNQYLGTAWALALLAAAWWGAVRDEPRAALHAELVVAGALGLAVLGTLGDLGRITLRGLAVSWVDSTADLRAYGAERSVYHPVYSDATYEHDGRVWQDVPNLADLLAAGEQPGELLSALFDRRFDAVVPFEAAIGDRRRRTFGLYASAFGKREADWFWKVDQVIASRYAAAVPGPGIPVGVAERRPGPERDVWQRDCFGELDVAGATWEGRAGGGFWCAPRGGAPRLVLRGTRAAESEVVTHEAVRASGTLVVTPRAATQAFRVLQPGALAIEAARRGEDVWEVTTLGPSLKPATATLRGRVLRLPLPDTGGRAARLSLWGPRDGGVAYDLSGVRLAR